MYSMYSTERSSLQSTNIYQQEYGEVYIGSTETQYSHIHGDTQEEEGYEDDGEMLELDVLDSSGYPGTTLNCSQENSTLFTNISTCLRNGTTIPDGEWYKAEQLTFLGILLSVIVLGNSMVLVALASSKARKSRMNFFIMHLAAADLSVGLLSVTTDIVWKITVTWEAGLVACKTVRFVQCIVTYGSTYVLVALSIDRYDAITHPMNFTGSWRRAKILVLVSWILSVIFSLPILIFYNIYQHEDYGTQCWIDFPEPWHWKLYMTLVAITLFLLPAICIATCYTVIVRTIWDKSKLMQPSTTNPAVHSKGGIAETRRKQIVLDGDPDCRRASSRGLIPKAKVKTIKMTFVIVFVFILCWSPYILFDLLQVYGVIQKSELNNIIATFVQSLAPLNSAANPFIFCLFSANVGKYVRNWWIMRKCRETFFPCCQNEDDPLGSSTTRTTSTLLSSNARPNLSTSKSSGVYSNRRQSMATSSHVHSTERHSICEPIISAATIAVQRF